MKQVLGGDANTVHWL